LEYLEESYPLKPLLPKDGVIRFKVREICEIIGSGIQPLQNLAVLKQFEESKQKDWAAKWIFKGLTGR
jgi:maleylacetoacetate isomerase